MRAAPFAHTSWVHRRDLDETRSSSYRPVCLDRRRERHWGFPEEAPQTSFYPLPGSASSYVERLDFPPVGGAAPHQLYAPMEKSHGHPRKPVVEPDHPRFQSLLRNTHARWRDAQRGWTIAFHVRVAGARCSMRPLPVVLRSGLQPRGEYIGEIM